MTTPRSSQNWPGQSAHDGMTDPPTTHDQCGLTAPRNKPKACGQRPEVAAQRGPPASARDKCPHAGGRANLWTAAFQAAAGSSLARLWRIPASRAVPSRCAQNGRGPDRGLPGRSAWRADRLGRFPSVICTSKPLRPKRRAVRTAAFPFSRRAKTSRRSEAETEAPLRPDVCQAATRGQPVGVGTDPSHSGPLAAAAAKMGAVRFRRSSQAATISIRRDF
jgi:hypothetical protein